MRNEGRRVAAVLGALPLGWATATIGEIIGCDGLFVDGDWVESKDQDPKGDVRLTQLADVGDGVYRNRSNRFLKYEKAVELGCTFLQPNNLMVARMPDPLGRACIFPGDSKPSVTAVDVCIVRTGVNGADHQWLMHTINSPTFRSTIASLQSGSTRKRISRSNLAKIEFPLPPLPEQHRIVAKIEELFTKLDAGVEGLKKVKAELGGYRQAVLKYAFEGKLTEEWRESHKGKLEPASVLLERIKEEQKKSAKGKHKELLPMDTSDLPGLPEGWVWTTFEGIATNEKNSIVDGPFGSNLKVSDYVDDENGVPVLTTKNLELGYDSQYLRYISKEKFQELRRSEVKGGDILVAKIGSCGKSAIYPENGQSAMIPANLLKMTVHPELRRLYIFHFLRSPLFKMELEEITTATAQPAFNVTKFRKLLVPLPPLPEQSKIVEKIEHRFSIADETERVVEQSLMGGERLRQGILKRAFEGKLVPQDPNDEPAETLLERIKVEKAMSEV